MTKSRLVAPGRGIHTFSSSDLQLRKHEEALQILTLDLNDFVGAELYCVTGGHSIGSTSSNVTKEVPKPTASTARSKPKRLEEKELPRLPQMTAEDLQERRDLCLLLFRMYLNISDE